MTSPNNEINKKLSTTSFNKKISCGNCGNEGHLYKKCNEPLTSYGLICYKFNEELNKYQIILIRRKYTIGYIEFLRGKYDINNHTYISKLINMMTSEEITNIRNIYEFDKLRDMLGMSKRKVSYKLEYEQSKEKFNILKNTNQLTKLLDQSTGQWVCQEWGLPKGRRKPKEMNIICGIREFYEETGLDETDISINMNIVPLEEIYTGINGVQYKHVYYFAQFISDKKLMLNNNNKDQFIEISNIKWSSLEDAIKIIRPYYKEKISVIKKAFYIINNIINFFDNIEIET